MEMREGRADMNQVFVEGVERKCFYSCTRDVSRIDTRPPAPAEVKSNQSITVSTMEEWEKELMEDPKVDCIFHKLYSPANAFRTAWLSTRSRPMKRRMF